MATKRLLTDAAASMATVDESSDDRTTSRPARMCRRGRFVRASCRCGARCCVVVGLRSQSSCLRDTLGRGGVRLLLALLFHAYVDGAIVPRRRGSGTHSMAPSTYGSRGGRPTAAARRRDGNVASACCCAEG